MKKILAAMLIICLVAGLAGCGQKRESAESVVNNALAAIKQYDVDTLREFGGGDTFDAGSESEFPEEVGRALLGGLTYEIIGSNENANTATVDVKIGNVDMTPIMVEAFSEILTKMFTEAFNSEEEQMTEEDTNQLFADTMLKLLQRTDNSRITNTVTISLSLEDDKWKIDDGNDAAVDAVLGGVSSFEDSMKEAFGENITFSGSDTDK